MHGTLADMAIVDSFRAGSRHPSNTASTLAAIALATLPGFWFACGPLACTDEFVYALTIRVVDENGNPLEGADVRWVHERGTMQACEVTSPEEFACGDDAGGHYTVWVSAEGYADGKESRTLRSDGCHVEPEFVEIALSPL